MKKLVPFALLFLPAFFGAVSCVPEDSCKNCEAVTYEKGTNTITDRQDAVEYCGSELMDKENSDPVVIGNDSVVWECN